MQIREESLEDHTVIFDLTQAAFAPMAFSDGTEAACINRLRDDGDLTMSLVATAGGAVVGHVAFSPAFIDGVSDGWFGLGPISVWPDQQRNGIGRALIERGLDAMKTLGAKGCVLVGNPDLYSRFGFHSDGRLVYRDLPVKLVQWVAFGGSTPSGALRFSNGLE